MDMPLWAVYIPHFDQISVKISVLRLLFPNRCTDWGEIWRGGGDLYAKFHPNRCSVSPLRAEKPQNRPLSKLNTGACASRNAAGKNYIIYVTKIQGGFGQIVLLNESTFLMSNLKFLM